ncbi:MAG: gamma-glutamyltransferase [Planctomycetaceae bacterium]|nr:gamma-glutamyltransferase [Planctomycetaceae bacterium]
MPVILVTLLVVFFHSSDQATADDAVQVRFPSAGVAADHPLASEAGAAMLRRGGNVIDAAVATSFALSVVRPESCGIGGGGFLVYWDAAKQQAVAIDYRERAPAAASRDMYLGEDGRSADPLASRVGGLAVAVPGEVAGLCWVRKEYGTLDLPTVLAPAIRLAREGFAVDETFVEAQRQVLADFARHTDYAKRFTALHKLYLNEGKPYAVGDRFHSPLAEVLELIAEQGAAGFHEAPVAEALVAEVKQSGGIITTDDLAFQQPVVREPVRGTFDGYNVISMPPPSSGGIAIIETLNMLKAYEREHPQESLTQFGHNDPQSVHLVTEAFKHAFADRAEFLGDTDFAEVPVARLIDPAYAARLAAKIDLSTTQPLEAYGRFAPVEDGGTSHFCVIDREGNAVACTETINTLFGSYVVEPTYGIVLNNEMDDFAAVPGQPNAFGLIQSEANAVTPGKKPLSSMSPTILVKDGKAELVAGASGGPRIITSTLQVLLNVTRFGQTVEQAVTSPRFHHQWLPETLFAEPELLPSLKSQLETRGHVVKHREKLAATQAASRTAGGVSGASDPRKGGRPAGY